MILWISNTFVLASLAFFTPLPVPPSFLPSFLSTAQEQLQPLNAFIEKNWSTITTLLPIALVFLFKQFVLRPRTLRRLNAFQPSQITTAEEMVDFGLGSRNTTAGGRGKDGHGEIEVYWGKER